MLQHVGVFFDRFLRRHQQAGILVGALLAAEARNLELRHLHTGEQARHTPQLVVLMRGILLEHQKTLGLLVFGGGGDGEHCTRPAALGGDDGLRQIGRNGGLAVQIVGGTRHFKLAGANGQFRA